ncbi:TIGR03960 family B12-binding radical SAM protein [Thermodesulforhabdus norvegica]|nr:TIGR03960 family B12-binding radical SAM protein [Thermodesulforhabdus norvegica]
MDLLKVEKPGRYVGMEYSFCKKRWGDASVRWVLVFPDVYEVGLSHLGLRIIYHRLNSLEGVLADRAYTPWPDMERYLRSRKDPLLSIEQRAPLSSFDFVGFSLQYELSYTNILTVLDLSGIPLRAAERSERDPLVVAGGSCVFHAEPVAEVFDLMVIGEGEEVVVELVELYRKWKKEGGTRRGFLEEARSIPGVYVPAFFSPVYSPAGRLADIKPLFPDYTGVSKRIVADLDGGSIDAEGDIIPVMGIVHDRLTVEIARGCTRGCRFCQAGYIYRPVRELSPGRVIERVLRGVEKTGYEEASLLSLSTGDYSAIQVLLPLITKMLEKYRTAVSLPSLRVGTLTEEMIGAIKRVRKTGFTLAPEAGSERLRRVINKDISTDELMTTAEKVFKSGWKLLKLYFMIGLPAEREDDLEGIVSLCRELWKLGKPHRARLNVSVSTFVPKPHTPFQWCGQASREVIAEKLAYLKDRLRRFRGVTLKWHDPGQSFWEAVMARGDRRLFDVILRAWEKGARMDGWTEQFRENIWYEAAADFGISPGEYALRSIAFEEVLPWDHLSTLVDKQYIFEEYGKALSGEYTGDCRYRGCTGCGVCDFREIKPVIWGNDSLKLELERKYEKERMHLDGEVGEFWYRFYYVKTDLARFFSQTDLQRLLARAARRAAIPLAYSKGFHPHPRISFVDAVPVGMESLCETGYLALTHKMDPEEILKRWNSELPGSVEIARVCEVQGKPTIHIPEEMWYRVEGLGDEEVLTLSRWLNSLSDNDILEVPKAKGIRKVLLKDVMMVMEFTGKNSILVGLRTKEGLIVRPQHILRHAGIDEERIAELRMVKVGYERPRELTHEVFNAL